jgi:7,8-dihydropterin-6-yl-methyl-4-(beta-D-ribofuranosyl)aminobenzene 5'-phosphate synthase
VACLRNNVENLKIDLNKIESVILSHGHFDHFGGLSEFLNRASKGISLTLHPDAFLKRRLNIRPMKNVIEMPALDEADLNAKGVVLNKYSEASTLASNLIMVTGDVQRITDFEKGFPWAEAKVNGEWIVDPFHDDQGVAINVKGKGLVIIGGCSHAGIINTANMLNE